MTRNPTFIPQTRCFVLCALCLTLFAACVSSPQSIDVFILDAQTTQYFVRPIHFTAPGMTSDVDFTVRVRNGELSSVVCNFSLIGATHIPDPSSDLAFVMPGDSRVYHVQNMKLLFADVHNKVVRYTSEFSPLDFSAVFSSRPSSLQAVVGGKTIVFTPSNRGEEQLDAAVAQFSYGR